MVTDWQESTSEHRHLKIGLSATTLFAVDRPLNCRLCASLLRGGWQLSVQPQILEPHAAGSVLLIKKKKNSLTKTIKCFIIYFNADLVRFDTRNRN